MDVDSGQRAGAPAAEPAAPPETSPAPQPQQDPRLVGRATELLNSLRNEIAYIRQARASRTLQDYTYSGILVPELWLTAMLITRAPLRATLTSMGIALEGFHALVGWWDARHLCRRPSCLISRLL